jgi:hypothetical protein
VDYFEPARLRIERAATHSAEMAAAWNEYLAPHPFSFELVRESETQWIFRVRQVDPFPTELPILFGEWLYNLRSALDYIIWAAAVHSSGQAPPPGEGDLQYPIYDSRTSWERNLRRLRPLAEHHREMLLIMQPFNSDLDGNYLGWINRLARIDRHRTLNEWTARLAEMEPVFRVPSGVRPRMQWGRRVLADGVCDFARLSFPSAEAADGLEGNPRVGIDPEIAEWGKSPFWGRTRFSERLHMLNVFVRVELGTYEYDCTGASEDEALADSFKAESDARRARGAFSPVSRAELAPVVWLEAGAGRESSESRFLGVDYPPSGPGSPADRD